MYKVINGETVKSAFTMKQAFYYAENLNHPKKLETETTIELPDGCVLVYDPSHGDLVCKSPTSITFATPSQAAKIFGFFFEGVERGWIDLSHQPQMRNLHDWLVTKQNNTCEHCGLPDPDNNPYCFCKSVQIGDLDQGVPNHTNHNKRGFEPK